MKKVTKTTKKSSKKRVITINEDIVALASLIMSLVFSCGTAYCIAKIVNYCNETFPVKSVWGIGFPLLFIVFGLFSLALILVFNSSKEER